MRGRRELTSKISSRVDGARLPQTRKDLTDKISNGNYMWKGGSHRDLTEKVSTRAVPNVGPRAERKFPSKITGAEEHRVRFRNTLQTTLGPKVTDRKGGYKLGDVMNVTAQVGRMNSIGTGTRLSSASKSSNKAKPTTRPPRSAQSRPLVRGGKQVVSVAFGKRVDAKKIRRRPSPRKPVANRRISSKLDKDKPTKNPFGKTKLKTNFGHMYKNGRVPMRINHGSVNHKLHWDISPEELDYDPIAMHLAEGLCETQHPYVFLTSQGFKELMEANGATDKTIPLTRQILLVLRGALRSENEDVFSRALDALQQLSRTVGPEIDGHLKNLLSQVNKKSKFKSLEQHITQTLEAFVQNGGEGVLAIIKAKVPTFVYC
ncbi:hypothetical protein AAMO2058_000895800 [Amorphochlora amoebiformis]